MGHNNIYNTLCTLNHTTYSLKNIHLYKAVNVGIHLYNDFSDEHEDMIVCV